MKVYISGPMTGIEDDNKPAFNKAARILRKQGYVVINPAEITVPVQTWVNYLKEDIRQLLTADAIVMLPGWEQSKGANLERHIATSLGLNIYNFEDFYPVGALERG